MKNDTKNRIMGCLYGQAIGNALGLITEFNTHEAVKRQFPDGLSRYSQAYPGGKGVWEDDDTAQMLCVLDELTVVGCITPGGLARRLVHWFETDGRGCGNLVYHVIHHSDFETDPLKAARECWEWSDCRNAPNGALMRTACVGLWPHDVENNAALAAAVTHADPRCIGSCVVVSELIFNLVWNGVELNDDNLVAIADKYDTRIGPWILKGSSSTIADLELDSRDSIGYTLRTLSAVIWAVRNAADFVTGLVAIVNQGGDADTNAAIACAVLGAKFGLDNIPVYYIENLYNLDAYRERIAPFVDKFLISN